MCDPFSVAGRRSAGCALGGARCGQSTTSLAPRRSRPSGQRGLRPSYEQKTFSAAERQGRLRLLASPEGGDGSLVIHTDARLHAGRFEGGEAAALALSPGRHAWVQVARGTVRVNGRELHAGDGAALSEEAELRVEGVAAGEVLVFDLA